MKLVSLVLGSALLILSNLGAKADPLYIIPPKNSAPLAEDGLYLVTLACRVAPLPEQTVTFFEQLYREIAFAVTLSTSPVGLNQTPPATSILVAIPVTAATISINSPTVFRNGSCNQSFLTTGRGSIYLTAVWTDQHSHKPSQLIQTIEALAGVAAPLAGLVAPGASNLLRLDTGVAASMSSPYANLLGTIDEDDCPS
jgi:hypothetical protein